MFPPYEIPPSLLDVPPLGTRAKPRFAELPRTFFTKQSVLFHPGVGQRPCSRTGSWEEGRRSAEKSALE
jgi:hypothetical protein